MKYLWALVDLQYSSAEWDSNIEQNKQITIATTGFPLFKPPSLLGFPHFNTPNSFPLELL